jgi:hypothetical protein
LPELESKDGAGGLSKFKSLAGLAGVDLGSLSSTEAVRPDLYPNILQSTPFLMDVMSLKVFASKYKRSMKMSDFLEENAKKGLSTLIFGESDNEDEKEDKIIKNISKNVIIDKE